MLTIIVEGVKAQHNLRNYFYSFAPTVPRDNNLRFIGNQYGVANVIASYPSSAVQFSDSGDIRTVGDNCYTKNLSGVCTLVSKCSEIVADIRKGKNPAICSYQVTEAVVCCPKRKAQSNQLMLSNNKYINQYNQGSSTNQGFPINKINQNYPAQQLNQPSLFNYLPSQGYRTTQNQVTQAAPANTTQFTHLQNKKINRIVNSIRKSRKRKSEQKCEEYSKLATRIGSFTSLSISSSAQEVYIPTCTYSMGLVVGGEIARVGEFPHMSAIGWKTIGGVDWKCGGSLISEHFVLTAAHCSSFHGIVPNIVRLGYQNLARQYGNVQPHDYEIENVIVHPDYKHSSNYYDIALIQLKSNVIFTRLIRPACLWKNDYINSTKAVATGWGQFQFNGDRSDDLRKVALNILDNNYCQKLYESSKKLRNGIVSSQLCAGYLKGGKDTCSGDSGGPLQLITPQNQCIFHIIGVTSFGTACAAVNAAGVYTRVSSYLDWIETNVWP